VFADVGEGEPERDIMGRKKGCGEEMTEEMTLTPMQVKMAAVRAKGVEKQASQPTRPLGDTDPVSASHSQIKPQFHAFLDDGVWMEMASARGFLLPRPDTPCTTGGMERWLRKLGLSVEWYQGWTGYDKLAEWPARNPTFSLRAFVGQVLEEGEGLPV
jgi:hypothetical protein